MGSMFKILGRFLAPVAKTVFHASKPLLTKGAKYAGKEALQLGLDTVSDVLQGGNVKDSLKKNAKKTGTRVMAQAKAKGKQMLAKAINGRGKLQKAHISAGTLKKRSKGKRKKKASRSKLNIFD